MDASLISAFTPKNGITITKTTPYYYTCSSPSTYKLPCVFNISSPPIKTEEQTTQKPIPPISTSQASPAASATTREETRRSLRRRSNRVLSNAPPRPAWPNLVLNTVDDFINTFVDPPTRPSVDPKFVLSANFSPVLDELPPTDCIVEEGALPEDLDGAYIRNGPNPQHLPRGPYHLFDGDGMLHCMRIRSGRATLASRYVKTNKYLSEREAGSSVLPNVFSGFNGLAASAARGALSAARMLTGQFDVSKGFGLANTSLALFGGNLYAIGESDLPYRVKVDTNNGDILTIGRHDFEGKLMMSMTAHPKTDPDTNETFAFRYSPIPPFLTLFRFGPDGRKHPDVPIFSLPSPSFMHDFAITKKYAIFADILLGMNPLEMLTGGSPVGAVPSKVSRLGVIPRYAKDESEMRWFEVPGFNIMHAVNAWDEEGGDAIVLIAPNVLCVEHALEKPELVYSLMEKVRIDLKTGTVSRQPLSTRNLDFAVINPYYLTKKNRYVYAAVGDPQPKISGVVKVDVSVSDTDRRDCIVASRMYGPGCYGGEPFFVPKNPINNTKIKCDSNHEDEDDGYVVSYVHNENTGESRFLAMDAKSPSLEIVASVKLPRRVPYGFHGLFVKESDLNKL